MTNVSKPFFVLFLLILSTSSLQAGPFSDGKYEDMEGLAVFAKRLFEGAHHIDFSPPQPTAPPPPTSVAVALAPPEYSGALEEGKSSSLYPSLPSPVDPENIPGVAISKISSVWDDLFYFVVECRKFTGILYEKREWFYDFPGLEEARISFGKEAVRAETTLESMKTKMTEIVSERDKSRIASEGLARALAPPAMGRPHAKHQRNVSGDFRDLCLEVSRTEKASSEERLRGLNEKISRLDLFVQEQAGIKETNNHAVSTLDELISTKSEGATAATPLRDLFLNKEAEGSGAELKQLFGVALPGQEVDLSALFQIYTSVVEHTRVSCARAGLSYDRKWQEFITEKCPNVESLSTPEVTRKDLGAGGTAKKSKKRTFHKITKGLFRRDRKSSSSDGSPALVRRSVGHSGLDGEDTPA